MNLLSNSTSALQQLEEQAAAMNSLQMPSAGDAVDGGAWSSTPPRRLIIHAAWSSTPLGHPCRLVIHAACRQPTAAAVLEPTDAKTDRKQAAYAADIYRARQQSVRRKSKWHCRKNLREIRAREAARAARPAPRRECLVLLCREGAHNECTCRQSLGAVCGSEQPHLLA